MQKNDPSSPRENLMRKLHNLGLVALGAGVLAAPFFVYSIASAQVAAPQAGPQGGVPGQGQFRGQFGQGQGQFAPGGFGGGGGGSIAVDSDGVYVLQGNRVMKLSKNDLSVIRQAELPRPQGQQARPGGFGGGGQGQGQRGGNAVPPPSAPN